MNWREWFDSIWGKVGFWKAVPKPHRAKAACVCGKMIALKKDGTSWKHKCVSNSFFDGIGSNQKVSEWHQTTDSTIHTETGPQGEPVYFKMIDESSARKVAAGEVADELGDGK